MKALVTGATGFIGSHLCEALRRSGHAVRAMVRKTSDLRWISDLGLELAYADLRDRDATSAAVQGVDWVFHLAAAVRVKDAVEFERVNFEGTEMLAGLCAAAGVRRFVFSSSTAASGPADCASMPRTEEQECRPVSRYGAGKLRAEQALQAMKDRLHVVVLRFPVVYGPRDRDVLVLWRSLARGVGPAFDVCFSLVFVKDAVRAALLAAEREVAPGSVYFVSDGAAHTGEELSRVVAALVGRKAAGLKVPRWTVRAAAAVNDVLSPGGSILSRDKARELAHPWWVCSPAKAQAELGFAAEYDLVHGLGETFEWYRREGWL